MASEPAPVVQTGPQRYYLLDGLRGVAASAVVLFHGGAMFGTLLPRGYLAVDFFFMLSGFVLHHAYGEQMNRGLGVGAFMSKRGRRLYPVYALGVILGFAVAFASGRSSIGVAIAAVFGLTALPFPPVAFNLTLYPINVPAWSLLYELIANVCMVVFWRFLSNRALIAICIAGFIGLVVAAAGYGSLDHGHRWPDAPAALARITFGFSLGLLAYRLRDRFKAPAWMAFALAPALLLLFAVRPTTMWIWDPIIIGLAFPAILVIGSAINVTGAFARACAFLGVVSFPLYLIHRPALLWIEHSAPVFHSWLGGIGILGILFILSYLVDVGFDQPMQKYLKIVRLRPGMFSRRLENQP